MNEQQYRQKFGEHLRELRQKQGLGLRKLAARCNVDHAKISDIENAKEDFTFATFIELAKGLEIHPKKLLDFDFDFEE